MLNAGHYSWQICIKNNVVVSKNGFWEIF